MGHRSMSVCTRISLYIYIIYICIIFIGIYTLCIEKSNSIIYIEKAFFFLFTTENFPKVNNFESNQPNESCGKCVEWTPVEDQSSGRQKRKA